MRYTTTPPLPSLIINDEQIILHQNEPILAHSNEGTPTEHDEEESIWTETFNEASSFSVAPPRSPRPRSLSHAPGLKCLQMEGDTP